MLQGAILYQSKMVFQEEIINMEGKKRKILGDCHGSTTHTFKNC